jgi:hypothetical protein
MKIKHLCIAILAAAMAAGTTSLAEQEQETAEKPGMKKQTHCPVMGGKINKEQYVDVEGYRIYVCCPGCKGTIKADPDKYIEKMKAEGITPESTPEEKEPEG